MTPRFQFCHGLGFKEKPSVLIFITFLKRLIRVIFISAPNLRNVPHIISSSPTGLFFPATEIVQLNIGKMHSKQNVLSLSHRCGVCHHLFMEQSTQLFLQKFGYFEKVQFFAQPPSPHLVA